MLTKSKAGDYVRDMDRKAALNYINRRAKEATWEEIAAEVGESATVVYGWWRRQSVPKWRVSAIEEAAKLRTVVDHA